MRVFTGKLLDYGYGNLALIPKDRDISSRTMLSSRWSKYWIAIYTELIVVADIGSYRGATSEVSTIDYDCGML